MNYIWNSCDWIFYCYTQQTENIKLESTKFASYFVVKFQSAIAGLARGGQKRCKNVWLSCKHGCMAVGSLAGSKTRCYDSFNKLSGQVKMQNELKWNIIILI